jgi:hypothetical protein
MLRRGGPSAPRVDPRRATAWYWTALAAMAAIGGALRLWYVRAVNPSVLPLGDAWSYLVLGQDLATGHGYVSPGPMLSLGLEVPTAEFPPLFPAVVALLHLLGIESVEAKKAIVAMIGVANIPLVAEIARRIIGRWTALVAAALAMVSPSLVESDGSFMSEVIFVPLVAAALLAALRSDGRTRRWLLVGGLVGLAALARAEALLLVPLMLPACLCIEPSQTRLHKLRFAAALATGSLLVVAPWTLRNYWISSAFVPISGSANAALLGANCAETYREPLIGSWTHRCYERVDVAGSSEVERWSAYRRTGIDFMLANRAELPSVMVARLARTFGFRSLERWGPHPEGRDWDWTGRAARFGLMVLAAAGLGALGVARRGSGFLLLLGAPIALACLTTLLVYGNPRFRLVAEPSLLVLAASALTCAARYAWQALWSRSRAPASR